jgi:hypothetical protein
MKMKERQIRISEILQKQHLWGRLQHKNAYVRKKKALNKTRFHLKKLEKARLQWLTSVILATQEAEIRFEASPGK